MNDRLKVRQFLLELLRKKGDTRTLSDGDSLFASGRLASVDALELVVMLEEKYGLDFGDGFDRDAVDTIDNVMSLISAN